MIARLCLLGKGCFLWAFLGCATVLPATAQQDSNDRVPLRHGLYVEFLGNGMSPVSINYDYAVTKHVVLRAGMAYNWILGDHVAVPFSASYCLPISLQHSIEAGAGATLLFEAPDYDAEVFWTGRLAYRYQTATGLFLRPALVPFVFEDEETGTIRIALLPGLGIGYQF